MFKNMFKRVPKLPAPPRIVVPPMEFDPLRGKAKRLLIETTVDKFLLQPVDGELYRNLHHATLDDQFIITEMQLILHHAMDLLRYNDRVMIQGKFQRALDRFQSTC